MIACVVALALAFGQGPPVGQPAAPLAVSSPPPPPTKVIYIIRHGEKLVPERRVSGVPQDLQCLSQKGWGRSYNLKSVFGPRPAPPFRTPEALFSCNYGEPIDCRDEHGWYRTQQTIAALAAPGPGGLNLPVDNSTGYLPHICGIGYSLKLIGEFKVGLGLLEEVVPEPMYQVLEYVDEKIGHLPTTLGGCSPYGILGGDGTCCNAAAADEIKAKLKEVDVILVSWEHVNIQWLAKELGAPKEKVIDGECGLEECWPGDDFDRVYALHYDSEGKYLSIETDLAQGFTTKGGEWLGPQQGCGAVGPD